MLIQAHLLEKSLFIIEKLAMILIFLETIDLPALLMHTIGDGNKHKQFGNPKLAAVERIRSQSVLIAALIGYQSCSSTRVLMQIELMQA